MVGDRRRRPGPRPKTYSRWLTATLVANGVSLPLPREVAEDVAQILLLTGRTVHPRHWVARLEREGPRGPRPGAAA